MGLSVQKGGGVKKIAQICNPARLHFLAREPPRAETLLKFLFTVC